MNELIAPHPESVDAVTAWLISHGINEDAFSRSPAGDWIKVTVPVSLAEEMLDTVSDERDIYPPISLNRSVPQGIPRLGPLQWRYACPHHVVQFTRALARPH